MNWMSRYVQESTFASSVAGTSMSLSPLDDDDDDDWSAGVGSTLHSVACIACNEATWPFFACCCETLVELIGVAFVVVMTDIVVCLLSPPATLCAMVV